MSDSSANLERRPGLLIVEEEDAVRNLLELSMTRHGFNVLPARSGPQAVRVFEQRRDEINLVLLDVRMTGMSGLQTVSKLREVDPEVRCCLMTGDTSLSQIDDLLDPGVVQVFRKPFLSLADLAAKLRRLV